MARKKEKNKVNINTLKTTTLIIAVLVLSVIIGVSVGAYLFNSLH